MHRRRRRHRSGGGTGLTPRWRIGWLCALGALAACSDKTEEPAAQPQPAVAPGGWVPAAGTYEFTRSNGTAGLIMLSAQGRYSAALNNGDLETGLWKAEGGLSCLVPETGGPKLCYTLTTPDERKRFRGTAPDGERITVRQME